jgi:hypothetical protein
MLLHKRSEDGQSQELPSPESLDYMHETHLGVGPGINAWFSSSSQTQPPFIQYNPFEHLH